MASHRRRREMQEGETGGDLGESGLPEMTERAGGEDQSEDIR